MLSLFRTRLQKDILVLASCPLNHSLLSKQVEHVLPALKIHLVLPETTEKC